MGLFKAFYDCLDLDLSDDDDKPDAFCQIQYLNAFESIKCQSCPEIISSAKA